MIFFSWDKLGIVVRYYIAVLLIATDFSSMFSALDVILIGFIRYKMLVEFSNCLLSSIRLLQLKGLRSTFTNISPQIETLTGRQVAFQTYNVI